LMEAIDRFFDERRNAAANERIAAESDDRLRVELAFGVLQDEIGHLGDTIDDKESIRLAIRQKNAMDRAEAAAAERARAAARQARLRANEARIEAMRNTPDPGLLQYARDMEENDAQIMMDMARQGFYMYSSRSTILEGLTIKHQAGMVEAFGPLGMPSI